METAVLILCGMTVPVRVFLLHHICGLVFSHILFVFCISFQEMMLTLCMKLHQGCLTPVVKASLVKSAPLIRPSLHKYLTRTFADDARSAFRRVSRRQTLKERAMAPAGETGKE
jgi:hypothetical protein